jgi:hypothetical protein
MLEIACWGDASAGNGTIVLRISERTSLFSARIAPSDSRPATMDSSCDWLVILDAQ